MRLDEVLPEWHFRERHQVAIVAPPQATLQAIEDLTWREVPVFRGLMLVRFGPAAIRSDGRVMEWFTGRGFIALGRTPDELVYGAVERMSRGAATAAHPTSAEDFREFDPPGHVKMAINFRQIPGELTTETRVLGTDHRSQRLFRLYWLAIRAGSGVIRHVWLRAVRRRAEA